jgi:hypothetical protein
MTTIQNAIEESASTDTIVRITVTPDGFDELAAVAEGYTDIGENVWDVWGTDYDGDEWRIYATIA